VEQIVEQSVPGRMPWQGGAGSEVLGAVPLRRSSFLSKGMRVKVSCGLYAGTEGIIDTAGARRRLILMVQVLGKPVLLEVDPAHVEEIV